jgi:hypothetical protein
MQQTAAMQQTKPSAMAQAVLDRDYGGKMPKTLK